jgi:Cu/Ag efflux protein CusF
MKIVKTLTLGAVAAMVSSLALAVTVTQDGQIKKIDKSTSMVTIEHGPPKEQPNAPNRTFTYDYKIPTAAVLNTLNVGDKISFVADDNGSGGKDWTVTKIEKR